VSVRKDPRRRKGFPYTRLGLCLIVDDFWKPVHWWLNGRVLGVYVSLNLPLWVKRLPEDCHR
jgi:hypothetical protein